MTLWTVKQFEGSCVGLVRALEAETSPFLRWKHEVDNTIGESYLVLPPFQRPLSGIVLQKTSNGNAAPLEEDDPDDLVGQEGLTTDPDAVALPADCDTEWSLSVIYSHTWQCPVLYFSVIRSDGTPVPRLASDEEFVSYDQHPVGGTPACFLHPCRTNERMAALNDDDRPAMRLLQWLCLLLPAIGCSVSAKEFTQISGRIKELDTSDRPSV